MYQSDSHFEVQSPDPVDMDPITGEVLVPGDERIVHTYSTPESTILLGKLLTSHGLKLSYNRASKSTKALIAQAARLAEDAHKKDVFIADEQPHDTVAVVCIESASDYDEPAALRPKPGTQEYLDMIAVERQDDNPYGGNSFHNKSRSADYGNGAPLAKRVD